MYHALHISSVHTSQVAQTISFCTMGANICAGPLWSMSCVTLLIPGMLMWSLDLWKMCGPLIYIYIYIYIYNSIFIYHTGWTIRSSNSGKGKIFFPSPKSSRPALGPTQPPIQSVMRSLPWDNAART